MPASTNSRREFPNRQDVGFLQLAIVAEFELVRLGHDQSLICVAENTFFPQSIGRSPDGLPAALPCVELSCARGAAELRRASAANSEFAVS